MNTIYHFIYLGFISSIIVLCLVQVLNMFCLIYTQVFNFF